MRRAGLEMDIDKIQGKEGGRKEAEECRVEK